MADEQRGPDERLCMSCGGEILVSRTLDGHEAPIDKVPRADGTVLIFRRYGALQARVFAGFALEDLREQAVPLRTVHTCNAWKAVA
jgi:hypothetical protein